MKLLAVFCLAATCILFTPTTGRCQEDATPDTAQDAGQAVEMSDEEKAAARQEYIKKREAIMNAQRETMQAYEQEQAQGSNSNSAVSLGLRIATVSLGLLVLVAIVCWVAAKRRGPPKATSVPSE